MSFLFGGGGAKAKPQYTGIQLQTSSQTAALVIAWGGNRFAPNLVWYDDFASHKQKQKSGKGFGGSNTTYTYSASCIFALCEGGDPATGIQGIGTVWKDQDTTSSLASLGMTLFAGTVPQAPWGYLVSKHPAQAFSYPNIAYLAVANYDLGGQATLPNHSFEVKSQRVGSGWTGSDDADCAYIISDFLTNTSYGVLMPEAAIDRDQLMSTADATTTGDASYQTYCRAMGFGLSPVLSDQKEAGGSLDQWTKITNTAIVWTGYCLRFIPYCYDTVVGNGVTFVPNTAPVYTFNDDDYIGATNPLLVSRKDPSDCHNQQKLIYSNRANQFNNAPEPWEDQGLIEQFGKRPGSDFTAKEVTVQSMAVKVVTLMGKRGAYLRNTYTMTLSSAYILLEPMDVVQVRDPKLGLIPVQITKIDESDNGNLNITADEISVAVSTPTTYTPQGGGTPGQNTGALPGPVNTPIIFEPPANLTQGIAQVWAAVSGGNGTTAGQYWGGCFVYISADAGGSYQNMGSVNSAARQGKLTANLAAYAGANPDTTNTASVTLLMSKGELTSVSETEASKGTTLCYVGGEYISFRDANLTGTNAYDLQDLYRGLYGSTPGAHATNVPFARLDDNIFELDLPKQYVGVPLKFKFQSFNIWGQALQDLSDCVEYDYSPTGAGFAIGAPASVDLAFSRRTQADGTSIISGDITVGASKGPYLDHYDVQIAVDPYTTWIDVPSIGASGTMTQYQPALANTDYKARARAVSSAPEGIPSAWVTTGVINSGGLVSAAPNPPTSLAATGGSMSNQLTWTAPASGAPLAGYKIYAIHGASGSFGSATLVGSSPNPFFTHSGLGVTDTWRYWVVAYNTAGNSTAEGPQNATTSSTGGGSSLEVDGEGVTVVASATKLNFEGSGVSVADAGGGEATVTITGGADYPHTGTGSVFDQLMAARAKGYTTTWAGGSANDQIVSVGDMRGLVFDVYTNSGSPISATNAKFTVPSGKVAVVMFAYVCDNVRTNGSYYRHRLHNVTTGAELDPGVVNTTNWNAMVDPDGADSTLKYPYQIGVAGDVIEARAWTAGDGHTRTISGQYVVGFLDPSTGEMDPGGYPSPGYLLGLTRCRAAANIAIVNNTWTPIPWDNLDDTLPSHTDGSPSFTTPTGVTLFRFSCNVVWRNDVSRPLLSLVNDTTGDVHLMAMSTGQFESGLAVSTMWLDCAPGDIWHLEVNSGNNNVVAGDTGSGHIFGSPSTCQFEWSQLSSLIDSGGGGGGGGGGSVAVQDEGADVVNPATVLNFTGDGVTVTDSGGGVAEINITGGGGSGGGGGVSAGARKALYWRIRAIAASVGHGTDGFGFMGVNWRDKTGTALIGTGTPLASNTDSTWNLAQAFDGDVTSSGHGWYSGNSGIASIDAFSPWIGYKFSEPVLPATVEFAPLHDFLWTVPTQVEHEFSHDGVIWYPVEVVINRAAAAGVVEVYDITPATGSTGEGGGLYDLSKGVPAIGTTVQIGDATKFDWTGNGVNALNVKYTGGGLSSANLAGFAVPIPGATFEVATMYLHNMSAAHYYGAVFGLRNSSTGKSIVISVFNGSYNAVEFQRWNSDTNRQDIPVTIADNPVNIGPMWMHVKSDGTNVYLGWSKDGANPLYLISTTLADWVGAADQIVFGGFFETTNDVPGVSVTTLCYDNNSAIRQMGTNQGRAPNGAPWYWSPPLAADFPTLVNSLGTNMTLTDDSDVGLVLEWQGNQGSSDNSEGCFKATPSGVDWQVETRFVMHGLAENYNYGGLSIRCSSTNRTFTYAQALFVTYLQYFTVSQQANAGQSVNAIINGATPVPNHMKLTYDNATGDFSLFMSGDGKTWRRLRVDNVSGYLGGTPDGVGFKIHTSTGDSNHDHNPVITVDRWDQTW